MLFLCSRRSLKRRFSRLEESHSLSHSLKKVWFSIQIKLFPALICSLFLLSYVVSFVAMSSSCGWRREKDRGQPFLLEGDRCVCVYSVLFPSVLVEQFVCFVFGYFAENSIFFLLFKKY